MITHYPTKRSVLVPILLYVQDELGAITDDAIHELAQRVELSDLEVRNVITLLLDDAHAPDWQVQLASLHERELPAARR